jgi:ribose-phosphate pyrophosphokinase
MNAPLAAPINAPRNAHSKSVDGGNVLFNTVLFTGNAR